AAALFIVRDSAVHEHGRCLLAARAGDRERRDVAGLEAGQLLDGPLDVLRPVIAAVDDDHVLGAADDEDVAVRHVAHVAGVEPTVVQARFGRFLVEEIAADVAGAADEDLAEAAFRQHLAVPGADFDIHAAHGPAAID